MCNGIETYISKGGQNTDRHTDILTYTLTGILLTDIMKYMLIDTLTNTVINTLLRY